MWDSSQNEKSHYISQREGEREREKWGEGERKGGV